jgi:hypothetical protein
MIKHVLKQMKSFPGGLGDKMEDWVELMHHQTVQRLRLRFRTVKCFAKRAKGHPEINEQIRELRRGRQRPNDQ